ncbi:MAG: type I-U CRISPR-associated protein Cas5/Cas6 [Anaerolineaceae bacterium]|nr:MAG: type I-U CRISPR-associated protein Cas5/Cas6 [Anaerolineaceae bacterium]
MRILLKQNFPIGRFHANPWRAFAFDDPYGEWPPSPWRLLRAILSRSFQFSRELYTDEQQYLTDERLREQLVRAFCSSKISWRLPTGSWRGPGIQQYQPSEFKYAYPTPRKFDVYAFDESFRNSLRNDALQFASNVVFVSLYQNKDKKSIIEAFGTSMNLLLTISEVSPELAKAYKKHVKGEGLKPTKYKHYFSDAKTYNTTKVKDNFWVTPEEGEPLYWLFESGNNSLWGNGVLPHLDECLARMTYFGRAESITCIERVENDSATILPNCELRAFRTAIAVPVLCPTDDATFAQVACSTGEKAIANSTTPPGAVWKYAERPAVSKIIRPLKAAREFSPVSIVQFAVGGRVFPPLKSWLRITEKFRGITIRHVARRCMGDPKIRFHELPPEIRAKYSLLTGKDANGKRLSGHRHAAFFLIPDRQGKPSRLICYRKEPFTSEEQSAMLAASETPLAWVFSSNDLLLRLVPLPRETPLPPAKNIFEESKVWETLTPYIPPLHVLTSNGKPKRGAEIETQIKNHLEGFGLPSANVDILSSQHEPVQWMKVHRPRRSRDNQTNDDKRGYRIRLTFSKSVKGPIFLGHSSHFGLGLFAAVE